MAIAPRPITLEGRSVTGTPECRFSGEHLFKAHANRTEFRDLKNEHFGLGFSANRSEHGGRLSVLLLIACQASFLLRLMGEIAKTHHLERQCQSNTRRYRAVLSLLHMARQLARKGLLVFPLYEFMAALRHLRRNFFVQEV